MWLTVKDSNVQIRGVKGGTPSEVAAFSPGPIFRCHQFLQYCTKFQVKQKTNSYDSNLSLSNRIVDFYNFCREVMSSYLLRNPVILGGVGDIVEIDESLLGARRKYSRGRFNVGMRQWAFGMIERSRKICVIILVPNRRAQTLPSYNATLPLAQQYIQMNGLHTNG
jgi:hypothetical protein